MAVVRLDGLDTAKIHLYSVVGPRQVHLWQQHFRVAASGQVNCRASSSHI